MNPSFVQAAKQLRQDFDRWVVGRQKDPSGDGQVIQWLANIGVRYGAPHMMACLMLLPDTMQGLMGVFKAFGVWPEPELQNFLQNRYLQGFTVAEMRRLGVQCLELDRETFQKVAQELLGALD